LSRMKTELDEELDGKTLIVYTFIAKEGRPVGTRAVARGANLSSPSVAFRHLQKLEALGLIEKNDYGDFVLKEKANITGHVWVGKNLLPRLLLYSFFFVGAFGAEIAVVISGFLRGAVMETNFLFLTAMTAAAMTLFLVEAVSLRRKITARYVKDGAPEN